MIAVKLEHNNHDIISCIDSLTGEINVVTDLTERFVSQNSIAAVKTSQPIPDISIDILASELQDIIHRCSNISIYGVPENQQIPDRDAVI